MANKRPCSICRLPHRDGQYMRRTWEELGALTSATLESPTTGLRCDVNGSGALVVDVDGTAAPGASMCNVARQDGTAADQRIVLTTY